MGNEGEMMEVLSYRYESLWWPMLGYGSSWWASWFPADLTTVPWSRAPQLVSSLFLGHLGSPNIPNHIQLAFRNQKSWKKKTHHNNQLPGSSQFFLFFFKVTLFKGKLLSMWGDQNGSMNGKKLMLHTSGPPNHVVANGCWHQEFLTSRNLFFAARLHRQVTKMCWPWWLRGWLSHRHFFENKEETQDVLAKQPQWKPLKRLTVAKHYVT